LTSSLLEHFSSAQKIHCTAICHKTSRIIFNINSFIALLNNFSLTASLLPNATVLPSKHHKHLTVQCTFSHGKVIYERLPCFESSITNFLVRMLETTFNNRQQAIAQ
jgi:hypothetical protein